MLKKKKRNKQYPSSFSCEGQLYAHWKFVFPNNIFFLTIYIMIHSIGSLRGKIRKNILNKI